MLSICSIILITLPIPIIGRNFLIFYKEFFGEQKLGDEYSLDHEALIQLENRIKLGENDTDGEDAALLQDNIFHEETSF